MASSSEEGKLVIGNWLGSLLKGGCRAAFLREEGFSRKKTGGIASGLFVMQLYTISRPL